MTGSLAINHHGIAAWDAVVRSEQLSEKLAEEALEAMEAARSRHLDSHRPAAERIAAAADGWDRDDLRMRSELLLADIDARQGSPLRAMTIIRDICEQAMIRGDNYVAARANFLLATIDHAIGDMPSARIHGIGSVDLFPEDGPPAVLIDHLIILAVAYDAGPDADRCYSRALDLTAVVGDVNKAIGIHNNLAYHAWQAGDVAKATEHISRLLELSQMRNTPLKATQLDTVARVHMMKDEYAQAVAVLDAPVRAASEGGGGAHDVMWTEPFTLPECMITLAEAYRMLGRYATASELLTQAEQLATERNIPPTVAHALQQQAALHAAMGDFESAYHKHVDFHRHTLALRSEEEEARARLIHATFSAEEGRRDAERFRELAIRDSLTGLHNRRYIDQKLSELTAFDNMGAPLSVGIVDADFFKRINDEISHEVGDVVLRQLAGILQQNTPETMTVGRLGGEEFVVLMPGIDARQAFDQCERLRVAIEDHDWAPTTGSIPVTVSVGVSTADHGQTSPSAILSDADRNLYTAKRAGRNRVIGDPEAADATRH